MPLRQARVAGRKSCLPCATSAPAARHVRSSLTKVATAIKASCSMDIFPLLPRQLDCLTLTRRPLARRVGNVEESCRFARNANPTEADGPGIRAVHARRVCVAFVAVTPVKHEQEARIETPGGVHLSPKLLAPPRPHAIRVKG